MMYTKKKETKRLGRMLNTPIELCKGVRKRRVMPCAVLSQGLTENSKSNK
jgi:hypothetical protein